MLDTAVLISQPQLNLEAWVTSLMLGLDRVSCRSVSQRRTPGTNCYPTHMNFISQSWKGGEGKDRTAGFRDIIRDHLCTYTAHTLQDLRGKGEEMRCGVYGGFKDMHPRSPGIRIDKRDSTQSRTRRCGRVHFRRLALL